MGWIPRSNAVQGARSKPAPIARKEPASFVKLFCNPLGGKGGEHLCQVSALKSFPPHRGKGMSHLGWELQTPAPRFAPTRPSQHCCEQRRVSPHFYSPPSCQVRQSGPDRPVQCLEHQRAAVSSISQRWDGSWVVLAPSRPRPTFRKYNSNKPGAEQLAPHQVPGATGIAPTRAVVYRCCSTERLNIVAVPNLDSVLLKPRPIKPWGR